MTNSEYKMMEYLEEAHGCLVAAAKNAHLEKYPEAEAISKLIDSVEELMSDAWDRFRTNAWDRFRAEAE
jgi:hypothetical protein